MPALPEVLLRDGELDVLPYYAAVAPFLEKYLKGKLLATKITLPNDVFFLKRGSKDAPLYIHELKEAVTPAFLKLRSHKLEDVRKQLTSQQITVWNYFPPRKLVQLFYATNGEGAGKQIDRLFFDIDIKDVSADAARIVVIELLRRLRTDKEFKKIFSGKHVMLWTGKSFHVVVLLTKKVTPEHYTRYLAYNKDTPLESFTGRWAKEIAKATGLPVTGGHEKVAKHITIDPSQTPSGKLARAPFSLHLKSAKEVDGVALPITQQQLFSTGIVATLKKVDVESALEMAAEFAKALQPE